MSVESSASEIRAAAPVSRKWVPIQLPLAAPAGAYSAGVRTANGTSLLFISGQTPRDPASGLVAGSTIEEQIHTTLGNLKRVAREGGATLADVVSVTVYLADEKDWGVFDRIYREVFTAPWPTRTVVGASLRGIMVEISAIAVVS